MKKYRDQGAVGALLDEYEKACYELEELISNIDSSKLKTIVDPRTKDEDCRSIQTILKHVVQAGYTYAIEIRKHLGEEIDYHSTELLPDVSAYKIALREMFAYNVKLFVDYPSIELENQDQSTKMKTVWGQYYDVEQIMEHAIVHVLRHRRQIERFLIKIKDTDSNSIGE